MDIEKEFADLHELLLACYDEDYEDSLNKALAKLDKIKKRGYRLNNLYTVL